MSIFDHSCVGRSLVVREDSLTTAVEESTGCCNRVVEPVDDRAARSRDAAREEDGTR
ncbi:hypothetical protein ACFQE5_14910 [Pseudonocardia hispaniensis]|uniref:Uncharacterized protein n=1 Tax=Pseudonocardia hispaniensis TaxID=904933 RepID=A0ABW1J3U7_9PSEU